MSLRGGYASSRMRSKIKRWWKVPRLISQRNGVSHPVRNPLLWRGKPAAASTKTHQQLGGFSLNFGAIHIQLQCPYRAEHVKLLILTHRLIIKAPGPVWAIPTTSRALAEDARSCPEAGTAGPAWSESPKGANTGGESAPRTKSGRPRMGLWEGDGHRSSLLCIVLPESALLAETRTDWHSATDGRMHLCPESSGSLRRTRAGIGTTLEKQRGPLLFCQTDSISGIPSDGSTSTLPAWVSVSTENRPQGSAFPECELPSKKGTGPGTKGEDGMQACPECATVNPPDGLCGTLPSYCPFWLWYDAPRERGENSSKPGRQPWVPGSLCARKGTLLSIPRSAVCLRRPRPSPSLMRPSWSYGDGGLHPFWDHSGEKRGPAIVKGVERGVSWGVISALSTLGATQESPLPWGLAACGRYLPRHDGLAWRGPDML